MAIILKPPLLGNLYGMSAPSRATDSDSGGVESRVPKWGGASSADPVTASIMLLGLLLEPLFQLLEQFVKIHTVK